MPENNEVLLQENRNLEIVTEALKVALNDVFGTGKQSGRFIDVQRIPLICQGILDIHANIKDINEKLDNKYVLKVEFNLVRAIVYGAVAMILTAVFGALIYLVVK